MRASSLLLLPSLLSGWTASATSHSYREHLALRPLPQHHLHAEFTFTSTTPKSAYDAHHYRYFPRSLAQILQNTHTTELHLRFGLGRWDDEEWGARPRNGSREGGTGVELWAWIDGADVEEVEQRWSALVNSLSGQFCASLNFIDGTKTTQPILTFEPEGTHRSNASLHIMHGLLPREVVCTENLTPFLKMLPCKGKAGISSLLDGHKLFDASWQSMSVDVRPVCGDSEAEEDCGVEIEQSISMALSIPRSMRDRHDPIPRPPPIEDIDCDHSKSYDAPDTCFPKPFTGQMAWSISKVFGRPVRGRCAAANDGDPTNDISLHVTAGREVEVLGRESVHVEESADIRHYKLATEQDFDLSLTKQDAVATNTLPTPPLYASRQLTGYGQQYGGMHTVLRNPHDHAQDVVYFESVPWYLRPFMHTLTVTGGSVSKMFYTPLIDRERGSHLELLLHIPAKSTLILEYEVEKAILRYTEYPPDANRGFDIGSAVIRVLPANDTLHDQYLRTTSLLLPLPTPDFSMPYNVIILTSTVIALGFGSIFNLLVRRFVLAEEAPQSPLAQRLQTIVERVRQKIAAAREKRKAGPEGSTGESSRTTASVEGAAVASSSGSKARDNGMSDVNGVTRQRKA